MRHFSFIQTFLKSATRLQLMVILASAFLLILSDESIAQATLSVQGIVKKSNGVALEDGEYSFTFKIYVVDSLEVKWFETISNVEVISGIYNAVIGKTTPLDLPFNKDYEIGVSIGSQEMLPRIRLTSAPYAISLRGETNQFPSTGRVLADELKVADGVIASGGAPGNNNENKNGYAFHNGGDNDGGLYSLQDGEVSLFTNGSERLKVNSTGAVVNGAVEANQLNLKNNGGIEYTSNQGTYKGWRLARVDDIASSNSQGWNVYDPLPNQGINTGWNNGSSTVASPVSDFGAFLGYVLYPGNNRQVLKKQYNISGSFTQIMVKFRYYFIDGWDNHANDRAFAGFAGSASGSNLRLAWVSRGERTEQNFIMNNDSNHSPTFQAVTHFAGSSSFGDYYQDVEMTARAAGSSFWVFIGAALDESTSDESYAVGQIEVWVR